MNFKDFFNDVSFLEFVFEAVIILILIVILILTM